MDTSLRSKKHGHASMACGCAAMPYWTRNDTRGLASMRCVHVMAPGSTLLGLTAGNMRLRRPGLRSESCGAAEGLAMVYVPQLLCVLRLRCVPSSSFIARCDVSTFGSCPSRPQPVGGPFIISIREGSNPGPLIFSGPSS